jgi:hypothetical protein
MRFLKVHLPGAKEKAAALNFSALGGQWECKTPVAAVRWLMDRVVMVVDAKEHVRIVDVTALQVVDILDLSHVQLVFNTRFGKLHNLGSEATRDYSSGLAAFDGFVYALGMRGVNLVRVMTWKDRIMHLVKDGAYREAIQLGLSFFSGRALASHKLPQEPAERRRVTRDYLVDVIEAYADLSLVAKESSGSAEPAVARPYFEKVVPLCVESCLVLQCTDVLFGPIFDKFAMHPQARGAFLECLRPLVMADRLRSLNPVVMKAFIEHYKQLERPDIVEECVLHMDVANMDINQMVIMCWTYSLFDALIYVYNQGMNDYLTPLVEMFQLLQDSIRSRGTQASKGDLAPHMNSKEQELGYKLLLYISFCLSGRAYPRGDIPPARARRVKGGVYKHILQRKSQHDETEYPFVRALLHFDTREFLNVLSLAFDEANDVHGGGGTGSNAPDGASAPALPSHQVVVDILLHVMVKSRSTDAFSPEQVCHLFTFIARQIAKHDSLVAVDSALFEEVLDRLTSPSDTSRPEEREQALLALLEVGGTDQFETSRLLRLAERVGFYAVMEMVLESQGRFADIIPCYIKDRSRQKMVYPYIHRTLQQRRVPPSEAERVRSMTIDNLRALVKISPVDMARLVLADFNDVLSSLVSNLRQDQDLQYSFLEALVHVVVGGGSGGRQKESDTIGNSAGVIAYTSCPWPQDTNAEESGFYLPDTVQETYLDLMCSVRLTASSGHHLYFFSSARPNVALYSSIHS